MSGDWASKAADVVRYMQGRLTKRPANSAECPSMVIFADYWAAVRFVRDFRKCSPAEAQAWLKEHGELTEMGWKIGK